MDKTTESIIAFGADDELQLNGSHFKRDAVLPIWEYTGPLDDVVSWFLENFPDTKEWEVGAVSYSVVTDETTTNADSRELAWRRHLGELALADSQPYADMAAPGETLEELKKLLSEIRQDDMAAWVLPSTDGAEAILLERWREEVSKGREVIGFWQWIRELSHRGI